MSDLVDFKESERSPVGSQASSVCGLPSLSTSVDFHVGSIDAVNKQISDSFLVSRGSVVAPLVSEHNPISSTHHNNKPSKKKRRLKKSTSTPLQAQNASPEKHSLIENATYPGYSLDHPTPLPQGMDAVCQLHRVIEAQLDLKCKPSLKKFWKEYFLLQCSQAIFLDTFWWFFLQKFQCNQAVQDQLFSRISNSYVEFLRDCAAIAVDTRHVETLLRRYPACTCQAVYSTFVHGYPASWKRFNEDFRTDLCNTVYMWQVGTKPVSRCWLNWNYSVLEPDNELKHMVTEDLPKSPKSTGYNFEKLLQEEIEKVNSATLHDEVVAHSQQPTINLSLVDPTNTSKPLQHSKSVQLTDDSHSIKQSSHSLPQILIQDIDSKTSVLSASVQPESEPQLDTAQVKPPLKRQPRAKGWSPTLAPKDTTPSKESHPVGQGAVFAHTVFDTYGHSPLVKHYLERRRLLHAAGYSILVKRTEVDKLPPIETPTYRDLINDSTKASRATQANFNRKYSEQMQALSQFEHQFKRQRSEHNSNMTNILSKPRLVHKLSNALLLQIMGEGRRVTQMTSCIDETLEQLKTTL